MAAADSEILMVSATHGSALGFVQGWSFSHEVDSIPVRGEGYTGRQADGIVGEDFVCTVTFLHPPAISPAAASNTLTLVAKKIDGTNKTYAMATMKARGFSQQATYGNLSVWSQQFIHVGTMATSPLTIT